MPATSITRDARLGSRRSATAATLPSLKATSLRSWMPWPGSIRMPPLSTRS